MNALSYEDPWLATASSDGSTMLIDTEAALPRNGDGAAATGGGRRRPGAILGPSCRCAPSP